MKFNVIVDAMIVDNIISHYYILIIMVTCMSCYSDAKIKVRGSKGTYFLCLEHGKIAANDAFIMCKENNDKYHISEITKNKIRKECIKQDKRRIKKILEIYKKGTMLNKSIGKCKCNYNMCNCTKNIYHNFGIYDHESNKFNMICEQCAIWH